MDYATKHILATCPIGHVFQLLELDRYHRRSIEAHKVYGAELRYVLDRYFFKEKYRVLRRARRERKRLKPKHKILTFSFKFLVYFKGPSKFRKVVLKEFTKRFIREKAQVSAPDV